MDIINAEAGPSRPSTSSTRQVTNTSTSTDTDTPPATPTKIKRRSWFGFASPSNLITSTSSANKKKHKEEEVELLDATGQRERRFSAEQAPSLTPTRRISKIEKLDNEEKEVLTIDGEVEETIKKKKKGKRRSLKDSDEGEVVPMADLAGVSTIHRSVREAHDPGGGSISSSDKNEGPAYRTFSRTASDRDPFFSPAHNPSSTDTASSKFAKTSPQLEPPAQVSLSFTPPDKILPPLPNNDEHKALPQVPTGIVVTPSSPHKLTKRHPSRPVGASSSSLSKNERKSRSASRSKGSRDSSKTRTLRNVKSFNIGLGLPHTHGDNDNPPPVPNKTQSVSSPLPSRGPSPTPRIVFAEPEIDRTERKASSATNDGDRTETEKRGRVKRARSLSGLLGRPNLDIKANSRPTTPEQEQDDEVTVKASGVLGWLGVKKTVKRRGSETKMRELASSGVDGHTQSRSRSPANLSIKSKDGGISRESLRNSSDSFRRPDMIPQSSSITVVPDKQHPVVFSRRSSSRGAESRGQSPDGRRSSRPGPITIVPPRASFASSRSSMQSDHRDSNPPGMMNSDQWASSPPENEETLFSPDSGSNWGPGVRPWMDGVDGRRSTRSSMSLSSPLGSLPEQGPLATALPIPDTVGQGPQGRLRSWSDAPLPQQATPRPSNDLNPSTARENMSRSLHATPEMPTRPKLPGRSSSGNSVIMGKMRSVFAKTTSRGRSQTLFRQPSSDVDEFGAATLRNGWPKATTMRPSSSSSSGITSRSTVGYTGNDSPQTALLGLSNAERTIFLNGTPDRSPRDSIAAASISSIQSASIANSIAESSKARKGRARASTMFSGPSSSFVAPTSPQVVPIAATPPRRRPSVMQRFSSGVSRSGQSSPRGALFPLPPRSSGSVSSGFASPLVPDDQSGSMTSPRPSAGSVTQAMGTTSLKALSAREEDDTPEVWLERVTNRIGRNDIANVLAASGDEFHTKALKIYMSRFDFSHNALDVALRRLLMHMSLPRETQQIDRVIEAFAARYEECEPGLFESKDNTYVLAFSMMMLHTDAFNRHNKNKMTKTDYVRNTRMDGVFPLVLEAFFDNITYTPFVFVEDDSEIGREPMTASTFTTVNSSTLISTPKNGKIDVYHMIVEDTLSSLRVDMETDIPAESQYSCTGTSSELNTEAAHGAFIRARNLPIVPPKRKTSAAGLLGATPSKSRDPAPEQEMILKVTKVGILFRRDETGEGKKSARKWKSWSVILTGSQLLFFKDPNWATTLLHRIKETQNEDRRDAPLPRMTNFKPDEVFPLKDGIAVYDKSPNQAPNTFRFVMPQHRQYLLQAADENDMNEWISLINYASTFKTAGVRIPATSMAKDRAVLAGAAAAASHKRELEVSVPKHSQGGSLPRSPRKAVFGDVDVPERSETPTLDGKLAIGSIITPKSKAVVDVDGADGFVNEGEQLEEVFDVVKAELATGRGGVPRKEETGVRGPKRDKDHKVRSDHIQSQISAFEAKARSSKRVLSTHLRMARNLAILTPFQKSTKDRIASSVPSLASKIRHIRLDLAKFDTWIEILRRDLVQEQREMTRLRHVALQAAAKSLRDPLGVQGVVREAIHDEPIVPTLSLPDHDADEKDPRESGESGERSSGEFLGRSPGELPIMIRFSESQGRDRGREPSRPSLPRAASLQSYKSENVSNDDLKRSESSFLSARDAIERSETPRFDGDDRNETGRSTPVLFPLSYAEDDGTIHGHGDSDGGLRITLEGKKARHGGGEGRGGIDDIPEEWLTTGAARRVSLANIPDLPPRLSSLRKGDGDGM